MDLIGFDFVKDEPPMSKADWRRIADALIDELETLEAERDELLYLIEQTDEKIHEVKNDMYYHGMTPPKSN